MRELIDYTEKIGPIPELGDKPWKAFLIDTDGKEMYSKSDDKEAVLICDMLADAPKDVLRKIVYNAIMEIENEPRELDDYLRGTDYAKRNLKTFMNR